MIKIHGCRVLVCAPENPHMPHLAEGELTFVEYGVCKILIPQHSDHQIERHVSEWEIVALGTFSRVKPRRKIAPSPDQSIPNLPPKFRSKLASGKIIPVPSELQVGQHVLIKHDMGFQAYDYEGRHMRIYSCEDIEGILEEVFTDPPY